MKFLSIFNLAVLSVLLSITSASLAEEVEAEEGEVKVSKNAVEPASDTVPEEAQNGKDENPDKAKRSPFFRRFLREAGDADGRVTRESFDQLERLKSLSEERRDSLFKRLDRDGDGVITDKDFKLPPIHHRRRSGEATEKHGASEREPGSHPTPLPLLRSLDKDGDGVVSFEEFQQAEFVKQMSEEKQRAFFKRLDRNNDGVLSPKDGRIWWRSRGHGRRDFFKTLDENKDGVLSVEELSKSRMMQAKLMELAREELKKWDADKDGKLQPEEYKEMMQARRDKWREEARKRRKQRESENSAEQGKDKPGNEESHGSGAPKE